MNTRTRIILAVILIALALVIWEARTAMQPGRVTTTIIPRDTTGSK